MTKKAGMESWKRKRRQEYLERKEFRYYIFCEGEQTEPQYFSSFKKYIESNPIYKNLVLIEIGYYSQPIKNCRIVTTLGNA